jgi:plastocyanin
MRPLALAIPVALLSLVAACSTSSTPVDSTTAAPTTAEPTAAAPTAAAPTAAAPTAAGGATSAGAALTGAVPPIDFKITLVDSKGAPVTTLKAGTYQVKIKDASKIHNFHLSGPGIDLTTTVPEVKETTWPVTLKAGTYTFKCDPHPNMKHTFTVS